LQRDDRDPGEALDIEPGFEEEFGRLAALVPELRRHGVDDATGDVERPRFFEAFARVLAQAAGERPLLVVLDDLHWADEPSLRLLGFLARALAAESVGDSALVEGDASKPLICNGD